MNKLKHALETLNPEELSLSNDQAQELDLENHSKFGDIAKRARKKQKKVEFADKAVRAALRPPLDVDTLRDAINASMSCKYVVFERWCLSISIISHSHRKKKSLEKINTRIETRL